MINKVLICRFIKVFFLICISFVILTSCDIIDKITGSGTDKENDIELGNIIKIEVKYFIDNASYRYEYYDGVTPIEHVTGHELTTEFTTIAGTSDFAHSTYETLFDNPPVLGKTIGGYMEVEFVSGDPQRVNIVINQSRQWNSFLFGNVEQSFTVNITGIPFTKSYTDEIYENEIDEFSLSGNSVSNMVATFKEDNDVYKSELTSFSCGSRAYIKVKVHYK